MQGNRRDALVRLRARDRCRFARDLLARAVVGARRRAAGARADQGDAGARRARTGVHRGLAVPGDGHDRRGRVVRCRPEGRPGGFRPRPRGYTPTRPRISRQSSLRRSSEPRRTPRHRIVVRGPRHLGDAARQRIRPPHARSRVAGGERRDGRTPWFVTDVEVRQVFSHCGKAFIRSHCGSPTRGPTRMRSGAQQVDRRARRGGATPRVRRAPRGRAELPAGVLYGEPPVG